MRCPVWLLLVGIGFACSPNRIPALRPAEKRAAAAYAALLALRERMPPPHPAYADSAAALLERLHVSRQDIDRAMAAMSKEPERWEAFYLEVQKQRYASKSAAKAPR